jgi:hypothetical protein
MNHKKVFKFNYIEKTIGKENSAQGPTGCNIHVVGVLERKEKEWDTK